MKNFKLFNYFQKLLLNDHKEILHQKNIEQIIEEPNDRVLLRFNSSREKDSS